jgi:hypothetical protein
MHGAMRGLSSAGWLADEWDGPAHVLAMQALDDAVRDSDAAADALLARFSALHAKLVAAPCEVLLVGEDDALAAWFGAAWKLNRNAHLEAMYSGRTQDSSGAGAGPDLDQNVLSVGVRFFP